MIIQTNESDPWDARDFDMGFDDSLLEFMTEFCESVGEPPPIDLNEAINILSNSADNSSDMVEFFYTTYKNYFLNNEAYENFVNDISSEVGSDSHIMFFIFSFYAYQGTTSISDGYFSGNISLMKMFDLMSEIDDQMDIISFMRIMGNHGIESLYDTLVELYCVNKMHYCTSENLDDYLNDNYPSVASELENIILITSSTVRDYFHGNDYVNTFYKGTSVWFRDNSNTVQGNPFNPSYLSKWFNPERLYYQVYPNTKYSPEDPVSNNSGAMYRQYIYNKGFYIGKFLNNNMNEYAPQNVLVSTLDLTKHSIIFPDIDLTLDSKNVTRFSTNNHEVNFFLSATGHSLVDCYTFNNDSDRQALEEYFDTSVTNSNTSEQAYGDYAEIPIRIK